MYKTLAVLIGIVLASAITAELWRNAPGRGGDMPGPQAVVPAPVDALRTGVQPSAPDCTGEVPAVPTLIGLSS